jgi:hypothetical protein
LTGNLVRGMEFAPFAREVFRVPTPALLPRVGGPN